MYKVTRFLIERTMNFLLLVSFWVPRGFREPYVVKAWVDTIPGCSGIYLSDGTTWWGSPELGWWNSDIEEAPLYIVLLCNRYIRQPKS